MVRACRGRVSPQIVDQLCSGDDGGGVQDEVGEQRSLLGSAERQTPPAITDFDWPENEEHQAGSPHHGWTLTPGWAARQILPEALNRSSWLGFEQTAIALRSDDRTLGASPKHLLSAL